MTTRPAALLVEDDEEFARNLADALQRRGLAIDLASTWSEGLELFRVNAYELVIADYNLDDAEYGLQLLARMKMLVPSSKLVLISGALTPGAERALQDVDLIDAYHSKSDGNLVQALAALVDLAEEASSQPTDWRAFGAGYTADLDRDYPQIRKIDAKLRADVKRSG